jgi:hypothetical protein
MGLAFVGYKTKMAVVLIAAFVIGNSLTAFLTAAMGGIGGAIGGTRSLKPYIAPHFVMPAPWRDPRWRLVLSNVLGIKAPKDSNLIGQSLLDLRIQGIQLLHPSLQVAETARLNSEKLQAEIEDGAWAQWYDHYHYLLLRPDDKDIFQHFRQSLNSCFQTASVYILVSALLVPGVRHWWLIFPSCFWLLILVAESYNGITRYNNKWSTLTDQIKYLGDLSRTDSAVQVQHAADAKSS